MLPASDELREHVGRIPEQRHRQRPALGGGQRARAPRRRPESRSLLVDVPRREPPVDRALIDLDAEDRRPGHRRRERLSAAHAAEARRQDRAPGEIGRAEMHLARRAERLVRALQDALGADVDPRPRRHLPEHRQALGLEPAELVPRRPLGHEQRVRDQHAWRALVRPEDPDRLAGLDEQRLVVAQAEQRPHDVPQRLVRPGRPPGAAVDDELLGMLGDLRVEVVEQHSQRRLGLPRERIELRPSRCVHRRQVTAESLDRRVHVRVHTTSRVTAARRARCRCRSRSCCHRGRFLPSTARRQRPSPRHAPGSACGTPTRSTPSR